jgi:hypothetical protein
MQAVADSADLRIGTLSASQDSAVSLNLGEPRGSRSPVHACLSPHTRILPSLNADERSLPTQAKAGDVEAEAS